MALAPVQVRAGVGWQYAFTDLALILFMISAAGLARAPAPATAQPPAPQISAAPELADPVSLWRPAAGGPGLADWLAQQPRDSRQRLTIVARYAGPDASAASASAASLMKQASGAAGPLRMVIEPGETNEIAAALTWDAAPAPVPVPATKPNSEAEGAQRP